MERWIGKTAVVTGAASGIGEAIAAALLRRGVNVVGLDIQSEKLEERRKKWEADGTLGKFYYVNCDLSSAEKIETSFAWIDETFGGVDIMVNNAGVTNYKRIIESDSEAFERLLNINVLASAVCISRSVRSMRGRNVEGHVLTVNSVLGHEIPFEFPSGIDGCNGWNIYPSCKHATVALTHTVRRELAAVGAPIRITSISPGVVKTEIAKHSPSAKDLFDQLPALEPDDVADAVIYALGTRPEVQITQLTIQRTGEK